MEEVQQSSFSQVFEHEWIGKCTKQRNPNLVNLIDTSVEHEFIFLSSDNTFNILLVKRQHLLWLFVAVVDNCFGSTLRTVEDKFCWESRKRLWWLHDWRSRRETRHKILEDWWELLTLVDRKTQILILYLVGMAARHAGGRRVESRERKFQFSTIDLNFRF